MRILGLGNDMVDIRRIEQSLDKYGQRFINRIFTAVEVAKSDGRAGRAASYAKRFAAKEACAKALGTGFKRGVFWRDLGVVNAPGGKPTMALTGGALERLQEITPDGYAAEVHLTITDDYPYAQAIVMITAVRMDEQAAGLDSPGRNGLHGGLKSGTGKQDGMEKTEPMEKKDEGSLAETLKTIGVALLIALVFRSFAYQPFNIPSESMVPTLLVGDYLFVSKFAYGYSRHSLPFSPPVFEGRLFAKPVERGDVAVFKLPRDGTTDYIKRIVGLPGDRIQMRDGVLYINDEAVRREQVADFVSDDPNLSVRRAAQYRETLPNGVSYMTLDLYGMIESDNTPVYEVPQDYYFAMGDNRDNSADSRLSLSRGVGLVPAENLLGRAEMITFSTDGDARLWEVWKWVPSMRFSRFFQSIT